MDFPTLIQYGILISLGGTVFAGLIGLLVHTREAHRLAYGLLAFANIIGAITCFFFLKSGEVGVLIGSIPFGYSLTLGLDTLSSIFYLIITLVTTLCSVYAIVYVEHYKDTYHLPSLAIATSLFIFGMQMVLLSTNIAGFMIFWEIMSIASFFLVMADRKQASIKAALLYLVMTHLGAAALLAGFFVLSQGTLLANFSALQVIGQSLPVHAVTMAFILFLFGFGSKAGLVPLHVWLPEAHPQAPSHISALMSGVMLKVALYGFLRIIGMFPIMPSWFGMTVLVLGLASAIFGVLYAVIETDIKRTLAYSSIENIGLIFTMVGVGLFASSHGQYLLGQLCFIAAIFHAFLHAIFKSGLFLAAGVIVSETHTRNLEQMGGLTKRMPIFTGAFCLLALSAAALPPFGAFFGEWMFLQSLVRVLPTITADPIFLGVVVAALMGVAFVGGLAIFAMVKLFSIACLGEPRSESASHAKEPGGFLLAPILFLTILVIAIGAFAPDLFSLLKADTVISFDGLSKTLQIPSAASLSSLKLFSALVIVSFIVWIFRHLFSDSKNERSYHTWDCGQPITAGMEYTATAFSAPIRFFFRLLLRTKKAVTAIPIIPTNPWIARRTMELDTSPIFMEYLYLPIERGLMHVSKLVRKIQNGSIQLYLALIFITLIATLIIAL